MVSNNEETPEAGGQEPEPGAIPLGQELAEGVREGIYANEMSVASLRDEVVLDFIQTTVGPPARRENLESKVVARIVISHALANRIKALFDRLEFEPVTTEDDNETMEEEATQDGTAG